MRSRWQWILRLTTRGIWFRAALFSVFSVVLALLAAGIAPIIPYDVGVKLGAESVDNVLSILASSMLAVTTFSLTAMVSAFSGTTSTITPRATQLLVQDSTAQNALSTFLGAFLFSIVGICALSTGIYGQTGRVILFAGTVVVIIVIVVTLLRWIQHLSQFGRVSDTISRVEQVACKAVAGSRLHLSVGVGALHEAIPVGVTRTHAGSIGYVTHVDVEALAKVAGRTGRTVHVAAMPGAFVTPGRVLAWQGGSGEPDGAVLEAFTIGDERQFDQDPRLGLVVLGEIASRALSPGINDPGTAIAVLGAGTRVFAKLIDLCRDRDEPPAGVHLPPFVLDDLLEDLFRPIARDGAGVVEVAIRLQRALGDLALLQPEVGPALRACADGALARTAREMEDEDDLAQVRAVHDGIWRTSREPARPGAWA